MAFDMFFDNRRESIEEHEEVLFELFGDSDNFSGLNHIWFNFYDSPSISPSMSNDIVHELVALIEVVNKKPKNKHLLDVIIRLLAFFSTAFRSNKTIQCAGD